MGKKKMGKKKLKQLSGLLAVVFLATAVSPSGIYQALAAPIEEEAELEEEFDLGIEEFDVITEEEVDIPETDLAVEDNIYTREELIGRASVEAFNQDISGPEINVASITVSHKEAKIGDVVTIGIRITDETAVRHVQIGFRRPNGQAPIISDPYRIAHFNSNTGLWEIRIPITHQTQGGLWQLNDLYAVDSNENTSLIMHGNSSSRADLSAGNFTVIRSESQSPNPIIPDTTGPEVDLSTLTVSHKNASIGDTVIFGIQATDISGILA